MKKLIVTFVLTMSNFAFGQTIANCTNPEGYSYYHYYGLVPKKSSGFDKDKITGGIITIQKQQDGSYDILVVDIRKKIMSMVQDGGKVVLLRQGEKDATFLLFFPGMTIELYTLWVDGDGKARFDLIQSKGGDGYPIHKSAVLVGNCDSINFDLLKIKN